MSKESPSKDQDGLPLPRRRVAYLALAIATTMSVLDGTIANTALPVIARDVGASPTASIWVVNAFQLAVTASLFTFASLGQLRGMSRVYRFGVIVFILGSAFSALSHTLPELTAARAFQGLGASAVMAITPALLRDIFPRAQLGRALGFNALIVATSTAAGPTVGGLILAIAPWQVLFAINVPFGIANVVLNRALPQNERGTGIPDIPSAIASALGFSLVIWGIDGFSHEEAPWSTGGRVAIGFAAFVYFVVRQVRLRTPMIAIDLFRVPTFSMASATSFASYTAQGLAFISLPFFFQTALGRTPLASGLLLSSWPIAVAFVAPIAGRLADRFSAGILSTAGLAVMALGLALYAELSNPSVPSIVVHGVICGLGFGFFQSPNNRELIGSAPRSKTSSASGLLAALRVSGQTVGAALVAIIFGSYGAHAVAGAATARAAVTAAVPATLWAACACAGIATVASALRLLPRRAGTATSGGMETARTRQTGP